MIYKSHNTFNRKFPLPVGALQSIAARCYAEQKELPSGQLDFKRHKQSFLGRRIRMIKDPTERQAVLGEAKALKADIILFEEKLAVVEEKLLGIALHLPNDTHPDVPLGPEDAVVVLSTHGPPAMPSEPELAIGRALGLFDFEAAAAVTGSSWYYLLNGAAFLETALTNYATSIALKHGFQFVMIPDVVREDVAQRCGFQPRDHNSDRPASQTYQIANSSPEIVLSGTAEIPLAGMFTNKISGENALAIKIAGLGRSFRAEAGSRGVHQSRKVELSLRIKKTPANSTLVEDIRKVQPEVVEGLDFPFR